MLLLLSLSLRWADFLEVIYVFKVLSWDWMLRANWSFNYLEVLYFTNLLIAIRYFVLHIWCLIDNLKPLVRKVRPAAVINNIYVLFSCLLSWTLFSLLWPYCIKLKPIDLVVRSYCCWFRFIDWFSLCSWLSRKNLYYFCTFLLLFLLVRYCLLELKATLFDFILCVRSIVI